jgi:nucleoside-diphosphate-sugar epimerase
MKILFTGATGVIGREAVPLLTAGGHDVTAVSRSDSDRAWLRDVGARPEPVDLFDDDAVMKAAARMDAVIHYATAIPPQATMALRESWRMNDRLRSEATATLVDAAIANGVMLFVQQSITFIYADGADTWLDESAPVDPVWDVLDSAVAAEGHVARFSESGGTGVVLRMARMYGQGPASADYIAAVRANEVPIIGKGDNYVSSVHSADVATALLAGLDVPAGTYNVADDEPMSAAEVVNSLADQLGVARPGHVPEVDAREALKDLAGLLTVSQRVANHAFKKATGWTPRFASVREGWADVVGRT